MVTTRTRWTAALVAALCVVSACGGGSGSDAQATTTTEPTGPVPTLERVDLEWTVDRTPAPTPLVVADQSDTQIAGGLVAVFHFEGEDPFDVDLRDLTVTQTVDGQHFLKNRWDGLLDRDSGIRIVTQPTGFALYVPVQLTTAEQLDASVARVAELNERAAEVRAELERTGQSEHSFLPDPRTFDWESLEDVGGDGIVLHELVLEGDIEIANDASGDLIGYRTTFSFEVVG